MRIKYTIDGHDFADYSVGVSASSGLLGRPKPKSGTTVDWPDENGTCPDLEARRLQAREITLSCWITADSMDAFNAAVQTFLALFDGDGTKQLVVTAGTVPLVYQVYLSDEVQITKQWAAEGKQGGKFSLRLTEPEPLKMIVQGCSAVSGTSTQPVTIYWDDGTEQVVSGTFSAEHEAGTGYTVIAGIAEDLDNITATGTVIWSRL